MLSLPMYCNYFLSFLAPKTTFCMCDYQNVISLKIWISIRPLSTSGTSHMFILMNYPSTTDKNTLAVVATAIFIWVNWYVRLCKRGETEDAESHLEGISNPAPIWIAYLENLSGGCWRIIVMQSENFFFSFGKKLRGHSTCCHKLPSNCNLSSQKMIQHNCFFLGHAWFSATVGIFE